MNKRRFLLIYASQTGQAEAIAEELQEKAEQVGLQADLHCVSTTEKKFWLERETLAVIISSTTGDGDPPDTAQKFVRRLKKKTLPSNHLGQLKYAFLGLGDSNYTNFCNCGKMLDKRLCELGGQRIIPASWADDATGLEQVVDPWFETVIRALLKELALDGGDTVINNKLEDSVAPCDITDGSQSGEPNLVTIEVSSVGSDQNTVPPNSSDNRTGELGQVGRKEEVVDKQALIENILTGDSPVNQEDPKESSKDDVDKEISHSACNNSLDEPVLVKSQGSAAISDKLSERGKDLTSLESSVAVGNLSASELTNGADRGGGNVPEKKVSTGSQSTENTLTGSLTSSVPPLNEINLSVPLCPPSFIEVTFHPDQTLAQSPSGQNDVAFPSAQSRVCEVPILSATKMTRNDAVKTTLKLELGIQETGWDYMPGDAVGILCENSDQEVERLLERLSLTDVSDTPCTLSILPETKKKNARLPPHYPQSTTLRHLLKYCCDIRATPKKGFLRALVECARDPAEKRRLQELCSKQGSEEYSRYVRDPGLSLLDMLQAFDSVRATPGIVLEHCPRLLPRPYSAASSSLKSPGRLSIVFNIVDIPEGAGRMSDRRGVCTGMLSELCDKRWGLLGQGKSPKVGNEEKSPRDSRQDTQGMSEEMDRLNIQENAPKVSIYLRTNQHFRPPEDPSVPCILIGPGTGIAPFVGFLQYREAVLNQTVSAGKAGEVWLFFGCRHEERDFLFREELQAFVQAGVLTNLLVSFSRDQHPSTPDPPKYVQDNLRLHGARVVELICGGEARVYVCGDARGMARNVNQTFIDILQEHKGLNEKESCAYIMDMRLHKRYLEDVWT